MKKLVTIILCAVILFSGCETSKPVDAMLTTPEETAADTAEATATAADITEPISTTTENDPQITTKDGEQPADNDKNKQILLREIPQEDFSFKELNAGENGHKLFRDAFDMENDFYNIKDYSISFNETSSLLVRSSSRHLSFDETNESFSERIKSMKYNYAFKFAEEETPYEIAWGNVEFKFNNITAKRQEMGSCTVSYFINDNFTVNAFVKTPKDENHEDYKFIIDPAYMYGIPLFSDNPENMRFEIDGMEFTADTLMFKDNISKETREFIDGNIKDTEYDKWYYAKISVSDFRCNFNNKSKYYNTANVWSMDIITDDMNAALKEMYTPDINKDPEMNEVYSAITSDYEKLNADDVYGVVLLDMDFDEKPEVLVSRLIIPLNENGAEDWANKWKTEVDVYRVINGKLKYIDTIYNVHQLIYDITNSLGLKTLDDGTKGWYATSYMNRKTMTEEEVDYVYQLDGNKLKYTEIYRIDPGGDDYTYNDDTIYYMGKPIEYTAKTVQDEIFGEFELFEWNGYSSGYDSLYMLGASIRNGFTSDIEYVYYLYSDWLCNLKRTNSWESDINDADDVVKFQLNEREFSYNVAYMIDEYFLGEYVPQEYKYNYYFVGGMAKPVIYLYPERETDVSVKVDFTYGGVLTCTYPDYKDGWEVTAQPDGTLHDKDGNEYYCLYWEGEGVTALDSSRGYCVKGGDTAKLLREKLMYIGLTAREANEFIIYWLPLMQDNPYNVITFHTDDYNKNVPLDVSPKPDSAIRVFMTYYASNTPVEIAEQELPQYERVGFTLVEWGGNEVEQY